MRVVVFHHHLFKNAGTSVDRAMEQAFGDGWRTLEGESADLAADYLVAFLDSNPGVRAISSHTFRFPLPELPDIRFLPIAFIRHPLDRVRSAYEFERRQEAETEGAMLAKQFDFAGYVATRLDRPGDRSLRNFQTMKFSALPPGSGASGTDEFLSAIDTLCTLPFVGSVENFEHSMRVYERLARMLIGPLELPAFAENVGAGAHHAFNDRVQAAEDALGPDLLARFNAENEFDQRLYQLVRRMHHS